MADILYDLFLDLASLPETLISDQGGEFVAAIIQDLCRLFRVAKMETSSYHPQANGVAERTNRKILETLQMWVTEAQRGWHKGLKMVEYSLRLRPRAETGLSPFFCVHGREAGLPMDTLIRTERRGDMVRDIQERIDMMEMAERVIDAAYGVRQKRIDTLNEAVKRPVSFAEGDLVMIEQQPEQGRGKKLDPSYDGPWQLMRSDRTGLSFSARMMGRRVRHTIAHISNMKPYHHRPSSLSITGVRVHAKLTTEQMAELAADAQIYAIYDRMAGADGAWQYKWLKRDGKISGWVSEKQMLELVMPWTLDTFHALYELRPESEQPVYARRPETRESAQLSREEALEMFPRGTVLVREHKERNKPLTYIWGRIDGYLKPYWRARYDDGCWEDMTKTDVKGALALAETIRQRAQRDGVTAERPVLTLVTCPRLPTDFGAAYEGETVRYYSESTGWARGKLVKYLARRSKFTFEVLINGETRMRTLVLRPGYYQTGDGEEQPKNAATKHSAWNVLVSKAVDGELRDLEAAGDSGEGVGDSDASAGV